MKERAILFSAPMVRAILEGRKTVTRRVMRIQPTWIETSTGGHWLHCHSTGFSPFNAKYREGLAREGAGYGAHLGCPYGGPGDRLWVRETWARVNDCPDFQESGRGQGSCGCEEDHARVIYRATDDAGPYEWQDDSGKMHPMIWRPSIYMPRWASRITLEVVTLRVERLQDITNDDAKAEGTPRVEGDPDEYPCLSCELGVGPKLSKGSVGCVDCSNSGVSGPRAHFAALWDSINGKREGASWDDNPWVAAISFRRMP